MGMFDRVWATCPECHSRIELQSKGGECNLDEYEIEEPLPCGVAGGIVGDKVVCPNPQCHTEFKVKVRAQPQLYLSRVREYWETPEDER